MKNIILLELADMWEIRSKIPSCQDDSEIPNAKAQGEREQLHACADDLRMLVQLSYKL